MKHKHHIIPKHVGGTNEASNLILLTVEEHADAHRLLYEEHKRWQDFLAWKMLSGQIGKEEGIRIAQQESGRRLGMKYGKINGNLSKKLCLGWHSFDLEKRRENGLKTVALKRGIHADGFDKSIGGKKGGEKCRDEKLGFHSLTADEKSKINKDTIWIHKDGVERRTTNDCVEKLIADGWMLGRNPNIGVDYVERKVGFLSMTKDERARNTRGRIWIHKNGSNKRIRPNQLDSYLNDGWIKGQKRNG